MKKKIMFLVNHEVVIYNFRKELVIKLLEENYEVIICTTQGQKIKELENMGCKIILQNFDRRGKNPLKDISIIKSYCEAVIKYKPDIILSYTIKPNIYGGIVSQIFKIPLISTITGLGSSIHNHNIFKKIVILSYKIALRKSYKIFVQNQKDFEFFAGNGFRKKTLNLVLGSGVNLNEFEVQKYPEDDDELRILYIGRVMEEKGIRELLDAAMNLKDKNITFNIAGFFDNGFLVDKSKYKNVNFLGEVTDVKSLLKTTHAVILPSYHEGMSNALLESAASGRPLLATNIHGCKEIIDDGINGYLFEKKSSLSIIESVETFYRKSHDEKIKMGLNSREKVEEKFDRKKITNEYYKKIQEAIK